MVRWGRSCPKGFLPVHSCATEEDAKRLVVMTCKKDLAGNYVAPYLEQEQTLENLGRFAELLQDAEAIVKGERSAYRGQGTV